MDIVPRGTAIKLFHVGAVGAFDLAVITGSGDGDEGMANLVGVAKGIEGVLTGVVEEEIGELDAVIGLDAAEGKREEAKATPGEVDGILSG